jgi:hypothetical protein
VNRFSALSAATLLSAIMVIAPKAHAIEIQQFDKMADADQDEYVADLVIGAQQVLKKKVRPTLPKRCIGFLLRTETLRRMFPSAWFSLNYSLRGRASPILRG